MSDWKIVIPLTSDDVNECENPSAEIDATGYSASGTNTVARSTEQQWRGAASIKATYSNSTTLVNYAHTFLHASTTYYVKARLYVPSNWDGGDISINIASYSSATSTNNVIFTDGTDAYGVWHWLKTTVVLAADVAGTITLTTNSNPTAGRIVYLDALYISTNDGLYFDGDETPGFSFWQGNRHASASQMDYRNRKHGTLYDPESTGVKFGYPVGIDFPPHENQLGQRALGRGAEYQRTRININYITFPLIIPAGTETQYHSRKKALEQILKTNATPAAQGMTWEYYGANEARPVCVDVRLEDMSLNKSNAGGKSGFGALRLLAENPRWYERGESYTALTRSSSLSVSYLLGWLNASTSFDNLGNNGTGQVRTLFVDENNDVYIGGQFLNWAANGDADNIARYVHATDSWTSVFAGGANSTVYEIIGLDDGRKVIVGAFTSLGGTAVNRAGLWDGSTVTGFSTGFNGDVNTVIFDYQNRKLYFGGAFTTPYNRIACWNLTTGAFEDLDGGANSDVYSLALHPSGNGLLYAAGNFTTVGSPAVTAYYMARYNPSTQTWSRLTNNSTGAGSGTDGPVRKIIVADGKIFVGGSFTSASNTTVSNVATRSLGNYHWDDMDGGVDGGLGYPVEFMYWDNAKKKLLVSGQFTSLVNHPTRLVDRAVYWNGATYETLGLDFPGTATVYAFAKNPNNGDYFYVFDTTGTMTVPSATTTITNNGTDATKPVFIFKGSGTIGTAYATLDFISNLTTGARLAFNDLTLYEGSEVVIDMSYPGGARVYRRVGQTITELTSGAFARESDITAFDLQPGVNLLVVAARDANGTPSIDGEVRWRNTHWTASGTAA